MLYEILFIANNYSNGVKYIEWWQGLEWT